MELDYEEHPSWDSPVPGGGGLYMLFFTGLLNQCAWKIQQHSCQISQVKSKCY